MAQEIEIRGANAVGKVRGPINVILLSFVTFGIYFYVWYFKTNKELAKLGTAKGTDELGTSPGTSLLAMTLGLFLIVPPFISLFHTWKRLNAATKLTGVDGTEAGLGFLLALFISPIGVYLFQTDMNKVLEAQAATA